MLRAAAPSACAASDATTQTTMNKAFRSMPGVPACELTENGDASLVIGRLTPFSTRKWAGRFGYREFVYRNERGAQAGRCCHKTCTVGRLPRGAQRVGLRFPAKDASLTG